MYPIIFPTHSPTSFPTIFPYPIPPLPLFPLPSSLMTPPTSYLTTSFTSSYPLHPSSPTHSIAYHPLPTPSLSLPCPSAISSPTTPISSRTLSLPPSLPHPLLFPLAFQTVPLLYSQPYCLIYLLPYPALPLPLFFFSSNFLIYVKC